MKQPIGSRLLALLLVMVMLFAMVPTAWAAEGRNDATQNGGLAQDSKKFFVSLEKRTMQLKEGETVELKANLSQDPPPVDGGEVVLPEDATVKWESTDPQEVEVIWKPKSLTAKVKAIKTADTHDQTKEVSITVTVKINGETIKDTCNITVSPNEPDGVTVKPSSLEMAPGHTEKLSAKVTPSTAEQKVSWRSNYPSIASVNEEGEVKANAAGKARIAATSKAGLEAYCDVTVQGIVFDEKSITLKKGENGSVKYIVYGDSIKEKKVEWSSDDPGTVQVEDGYLYPKAEGTTTITAKVFGTSYTDTCEVKVERVVADDIKPSKPISPGTVLDISSLSSGLKTQCRKVLGGKDLSYLSGLSVSTKEGTLYYQYRDGDDTGRGISPSETFFLNPSLGQNTLSEVYFVPQPGFSGTATISYTGYAGPLAFFQGTIRVEVEEVNHIVYDVSGGMPLQFKADDFNTVCLNTTGRNLKRVVFTLPDSNRGALYRNYISPVSPGIPVRSGDTFQVSGTPSLSDLYFVPAAGYSGTVVLSYTAVDVNGQSYRSRVEVKVNPEKPSGDINYNVAQGGTVTLNKEDFVRLCKNFTGGTLDHVRFTPPPASQGKLYFDYTSASNPGSLVAKSQNYYVTGAPNLKKITFAASKTQAGVVVIPFTGWDNRGNNFSGQVEIAVRVSGAGDIRYSANNQGKATFEGDDFNALSKQLTGDSLRYVQFTLPSENQGTLYYNNSKTSSGEKVSTRTKYYFSGSPNLDKITFVSASGFQGTATMSFTGWSTKNASFTGTVEVQVDRSGGATGLQYTVRQGQSVTFNGADFNVLCQEETDQELRYVRFSLPEANQGTLYYNYENGKYESKVDPNRSYYRTSSPSLDKVAFVPSGYLGTLSVYFDGWSTNGKKFSGAVKITVEQNRDSIISYTTEGIPMRLRTEDFRRACQAQGVSDVETVSFTPPSSTWGRLCYQYTSPLHYASEVRPGTAYRLNGSPTLSDVTFVPRADTRGTLSIPYVATGSNGRTCAGTVQITLQPNTTSRHFTDLDRFGWAASAVDYLYENAIANGTGNGRYQPASTMTRGDFVLMLARGFDLHSSSSGNFPDVPADSYYADAVAAARELGITNGYEDGTFRPKNTLSRQEAMVFLQRTLQATGWYVGNGSEATLSSFADGAQVSGFARGAVAAMVEQGILYGSANNRLNPWGNLSRAEMAVLLHRTLTL